MHTYGDDFLKRGMAVLAIDGPGQGELEFDTPMRHDYEVPIRYAIDYLETRPDLDANCIGMMGVSLGGYYAPRAAACEPRIKATISNGGGYSLGDYFDSRPGHSKATYIARLKAADEADAKAKLRQFNLQGVVEKIEHPLLVIVGGKDR